MGGQLQALAVPVEIEQLKLLHLEAEQLKWIGANEARRKLEAGAVLSVLEEARNKAQSIDQDERVAITLTKLAETASPQSNAPSEARTKARDRLFLLLIALHEAAAVRASGTLPADLADIRDTQTEWRYAILRGARARSAEQLLQSAASRIALYYKGGVKPAQIAQLLYNLSGLVSLPIIAAK
jgi:hypothetical protein